MKETLTKRTKISKPLKFIGSLLLLIGLITVSCAQDSIFYILSMENEPKDPLIPGTPTNMVIIDDKLYAGTRFSKRIYSYSPVTSWSYKATPVASLGDLAAIGTDLYALLYPGNPADGSIIRKYDVTKANWDNEDIDSDVPEYRAQTIFSAGGKIFLGAMKGPVYAILYYDPVSGNPLALVRDIPVSSPESNPFPNNLLKGAVEHLDFIYFAMSSDGVYKFDSSIAVGAAGIDAELTQVPGTVGSIVGIIETGGVIVAVSSSGKIFTLDTGETEFSELVPRVEYTDRPEYTGAMCIWSTFDGTTPDPALLLLGVQNRNNMQNQGYREMTLDPITKKPTDEIKPPGDEGDILTSAAGRKEKHQASIGKTAVNGIIQFPVDKFGAASELDVPVFAATNQKGLWSYKSRGGDYQWNAEDY